MVKKNFLALIAVSLSAGFIFSAESDSLVTVDSMEWPDREQETEDMRSVCNSPTVQFSDIQGKVTPSFNEDTGTESYTAYHSLFSAEGDELRRTLIADKT